MMSTHHNFVKIGLLFFLVVGQYLGIKITLQKLKFVKSLS